MSNSGKSPRGKDADAAVRGAIYTSHRAAGALPEEMIPTRAYQLYREREARSGDATGDWLAAEREQRENIGTRAQPTLGTVGHRRAQ